MKMNSFFTMLCSGLLVYQPMAAPAADSKATLGQIMVSGQADINGVTTSKGASVFVGDQVATQPHSVAEILLAADNKVLLPESSAVVLDQEAGRVVVNLKQGSLAVLSKTSTPAFFEANGARIKPAADVADVLEIAVRGNSLKILARRGSATVEAADKTLEVEEGKELDATVAPPSPPPQGFPQVAAHSRLETWVFITAVAAGLTGLALGIVAITRPNPAACTVISPGSPGSTLKCP